MLKLTTVATVGLALSCGFNPSGGSKNEPIHALASVPKITGPVIPELAITTPPVDIATALTSETQGFGTEDGREEGFWKNKSAVFCETGRDIVEFVTTANKADHSLCVVKAAAGRGSLPNFAENEWNYYRSEKYNDLRLKIKAETANGTLNKFTMFTCSTVRINGQEASNTKAKDAVILTLSADSSVTGSVFISHNYPLVTNKDYSSSTTEQTRAVISGRVDENARWLSKKITVSYAYDYFLKIDPVVDNTPGVEGVVEPGRELTYERARRHIIEQGPDFLTIASKLIRKDEVLTDASENIDESNRRFAKLRLYLEDGTDVIRLGRGSAILDKNTAARKGLTTETRSWDQSGIAITPTKGVSYYDDVSASDLGEIESLDQSKEDIMSATGPREEDIWDCEPEDGKGFEDFSLAGDNSEIGNACLKEHPTYYSGWSNCSEGTYENP